MRTASISAFVLASLAAIAQADFCPSVDGIPKVSLPPSDSLDMVKVKFTFKSSTPSMTLDLLRKGLICRGAVLDEPDYNAKTISGYANKGRVAKVTKAKHYVKADYDDAVTTKAPSNRMASESATASGSASGGSSSSKNAAAPVTATLSLVAAAAAIVQLL